MKRSKNLIVWLIGVGLAALVLGGCDAITPGQTEEQPTSSVAEVVLSGPTGRVVAEAEVVPFRFTNLSFIRGGVIEEVNFDEGEQVEAGQIIAVLEGQEHLEAAVAAAELELLNAKQALDDLYDNAEIRRAEAEFRHATAARNLDELQDDLVRLTWPYGNQEKIDEAYAEYILAQNRVDDTKEEYDKVANRAEDDEERANKLALYAQARERRDRAWVNLEYLRGTADEFEVSEKEAEVELARVELDEAARDLVTLGEGLDPDEIDLAEARIRNAEAQLTAANADLDDVDLEAPFTGTIVSSDLKVGELVNSGTAVVTLADLSTWKVETTDLTELDVTEIAIGDPVIITLDAIPGLELAGSVERIKMLGELKQGDVTYTIIIALDDTDDQLRWKMTAFAAFE
jgi:multidrug resistance efflux pump